MPARALRARTVHALRRPVDGRHRERNTVLAYEVPSEEDVAALVEAMDTRGFAVLPDYLHADDLDALRSFVAKTVLASHGEYVALTGTQSLSGTLLHDWATAPHFVTLCRRLCALGTGRPAPDEPFYQVLRCLAGDSGRRESMIFHYDSSVLTVLLPICIPERGRTGDLLMLPNVRRIRRSYLRNLLDKLLVDGPIPQRVLAWCWRSGRLKFVRIRMRPGSLYFFWGYRCLHANEPCDPEHVRATALFHYVDVHRDSALARRVRGLFGSRKPESAPPATPAAAPLPPVLH